MNPYYTDYAEYLSRFFPGRKVQKISVNAGMGCPNRDGRIGTGGCIYCNNASFTPGYCFGQASIASQLEAGKLFFSRKYPNMQYIAYFQSFTNTYSDDPRRLREVYREAVEVNDVVGLAVGTRPDCFDGVTAGLLGELNRELPVFVEFGVETMRDDTLGLINRGHSSRDSEDAVRRAAGAGLHVGVHLIAGLPGEPHDEVIRSLERVCSLPVESVKIHHLQVLRSTPLCGMVERGEIEVTPFGLDEYLDLCVRMVETVPRGIAIERFLASAPPAEVVIPKWGIKNYEFVNLLHKRLAKMQFGKKPENKKL